MRVAMPLITECFKSFTSLKSLLAPTRCTTCALRAASSSWRQPHPTTGAFPSGPCSAWAAAELSRRCGRAAPAHQATAPVLRRPTWRQSSEAQTLKLRLFMFFHCHAHDSKLMSLCEQ